jgi:PilZ domain-containing protein
MPTRELRAEARIPVSRRGTLSSGETWFPCMILDVSNSGFLMLCTRELEVGQLLDFRCELYPEKFLDCKIEIRHFSDAGVGTMITDIDEHALKLWNIYLEEQYSVKLSNFKKPLPPTDE